MPDVARRLADPLRRAGFTVDGVAEALGSEAGTALDRNEPVPAARAVGDDGALATLVRLFLLDESRRADDVAAAIDPVGLAEAVAAGLLRHDDEGGISAALDLRPHADEHGSWWVLSDLEVRAEGPDDGKGREHVLGTGAASMSLAAATVRRPVATLLDLGAGCGVQTLHAAGHATSLTATDVSERALILARATFALAGVAVEVLTGPWWEPVAGRRFDQVVCNPPFVPGPPEVEHVYRDAGLGGDGASALLVSTVPAYLVEDGVGQLLASWLITRDDVEAAREAGDPHDGWDARPRRWLTEAAAAAAPGGLDAWVVQRDVADPALHVGTWLRDAGVDPASAAGRARAARWLDFFAEHDVVGIGFGFVTLRRTAPGIPGTVVCEDMRQAHGDPLGPEVEAWLDRVAWLRGRDLLDETLVVPPTTALERGYTPVSPEEDVADDDGGWRRIGGTLVRLDGPQWRHDLDELGEALLAGCRGHLPLRDLCELLALAHGRDADELTAAALPVVRELFLHGMVVPR
ncbi:methyltransferase [Actinomycetospora endophytica]|uniref:Methyltransferase n=1 Tax=Actinomycetospora endophytica TaxID=2291215 RepID=A0ABS8PK03_9PSEU|nr:methyltransferase [Actinomycetospora endophytica]MCD2197319.1 methyltransferase [Actinomycetospora endophytica]